MNFSLFFNQWEQFNEVSVNITQYVNCTCDQVLTPDHRYPPPDWLGDYSLCVCALAGFITL